MKGEHIYLCEKIHPKCLCNRCKHDGRELVACCGKNTCRCPVLSCPDYEPEDGEGGAKDAE